jgi:high-affinity iron transporter
MIATFAIFLREGIEAAMIISVLVAYLRKSGSPQQVRTIWAGVLSALVLAIALGAALYITVKTYAGTQLQSEIESGLYLIAIVVLTMMTIWMSKHSKDIPGSLRSSAGRAVARSGRGQGVALFIVAFQAILREGLEAMVFTLAILFSSGVGAAALGATLGTFAALGVAYCIYRLGLRVNLGRAFQVLGVALIIFAGALLVDLIEDLQSLRWITFLAHPLWNTTRYLSESSNLGDVAHTLLGYTARPTPLEALMWLLYLSVTLIIFLTATHRRPTTPRLQATTVPS